MQLVGIPYEEKDCMELVQIFYEQEMGISLKRYYGDRPHTREETREVVMESMSDFEEVKGPRKKGDLLLIKLFGVECHIAVCIDDQLILHTTDKTGSVIERISKWERLIVGTYRPKFN